MSAEPIIAAATPADAATIADVARRSFAETFGHLYGPADLAAFLAHHTIDAWQRQLADSRYAIRLVRQGDELVGYAKLGPVTLPVDPTGPAIQLYQFYLLAGAQGTGIAKALMTQVLDEARARGAAELFLSVYVDNARARRFYERYGFERIGRYTFMVGNHADEDDLMRLAL